MITVLCGGVGGVKLVDGLAAVLYYAITYALTTVGAFAVVGVVQERAGDDSMGAFAGLALMLLNAARSPART